MKKGKLPKVKTIRNRCDALLTPIIQKLFPKCLLCGKDTEVAHHHIKKSTSSRLRYELSNLIPLCTFCHCRLHNDEILWTSRIITIKGIEWFKELDKKKSEYVKVDVHWFMSNLSRLQAILEE